MGLIVMDEAVFTALKTKIEEIAKAQNEIINRIDRGNAQWLDSVDVCAILNISRNTLKYYRESGLLPYSKIEGRLYFAQDDIDKILKANLVKAE